ncbi:MAG: hypothetical protein NTY13_00470 [Chlamydiae bacterium]|nr:hypothetical protein [Chlamydiota bacterium]
MIYLLYLLLLPAFLNAQTIDEKKANLPTNETLLKKGSDFNEKMASLKAHKKRVLKESEILIKNKASHQEFAALLHNLQEIQKEISDIESTVAYADSQEESSLWHHPHITLGDLIADYSHDFLYLLSPAVADSIISISSHLPVPSGSWDDLIELIVSSLGLQVSVLNPFVKQISAEKDSSFRDCTVISSFIELALLPLHKKVCYLLQDKQNNLHIASQLLQKFAPPDQIKFCKMFNCLILSGSAGAVKQLLELWNQVEDDFKDHCYKMVSLDRLSSQDVHKALTSYFHETPERFIDAKTPRLTPIGDLKIIPLSSTPPSIFLVGSKQQIQQAEDIISSLERSSYDPKEKMLFCYTCQNSNAEEVAKVLKSVYALMQKTVIASKNTPEGPKTFNYNTVKEECCGDDVNIPSLIVNPGMSGPGSSASIEKENGPSRNNFIVDSKSGTIIMVIEKELLSKIKDLLQSLDTPKKMVQIEVLLFEKRVTSEDRIGLNLLKVGSQASNTNSGGLSFNDPSLKPPGILAFFLSHAAGGGVPSFDLIYNFLLSQEEIQVNACPSVTTINQTPAKIALVDEISINNGAIYVDCNANNALAKESYSRAQYGITIEITPTIHQSQDPHKILSYITLETDITFDTTKPSKDSRPDVTRRNIKNQVRVADGETVVLGGLRRKMSHEESEKIPFWGEIPILGKLFGQSKLSDSQTEMFIFLTPRIINDGHDVANMTLRELCKRPGDNPCLINAIIKAKETEKEALFQGSMKLVMMEP